VSFDVKGKWLAATTCGSTVNIWDVDTGDLLRTFDAEGAVNSLALDLEGLLPPYDGTARRPKVLATGDFRGNIKLWDADKGNLLKTIKAHQGWVSEIAFTSRGMMSLQNSGGMNYGDGLKEWNLPSGESIQAIKAAATSFVLLQDGNWLAATGSDGKVEFWDLNTGKELRPLLAHTQNVNSVAVSPNGRWLVTGSDDKTVKVWKMK
jgi:WD40 repeat protein